MPVFVIMANGKILAFKLHLYPKHCTIDASHSPIHTHIHTPTAIGCQGTNQLDNGQFRVLVYCSGTLWHTQGGIKPATRQWLLLPPKPLCPPMCRDKSTILCTVSLTGHTGSTSWVVLCSRSTLAPPPGWCSAHWLYLLGGVVLTGSTSWVVLCSPAPPPGWCCARAAHWLHLLGGVVLTGSTSWVVLCTLAPPPGWCLCSRSTLAPPPGWCCAHWLHLLGGVVLTGSTSWVVLCSLAPPPGWCCARAAHWLHLLGGVVLAQLTGSTSWVVLCSLAPPPGWCCAHWLHLLGGVVLAQHTGSTSWVVLCALAPPPGWCCAHWLHLLGGVVLTGSTSWVVLCSRRPESAEHYRGRRWWHAAVLTDCSTRVFVLQTTGGVKLRSPPRGLERADSYSLRSHSHNQLDRLSGSGVFVFAIKWWIAAEDLCELVSHIVLRWKKSLKAIFWSHLTI